MAREAAVAHERAVIRRLRMQKCELDALGRTAISLAFFSPRGEGFFIPRPVTADGFTLDQLIYIEAVLNVFDLEPLPLDPNVN